MARFLGIPFSELWFSWFKANVWSLFSGIPAMFICASLGDWLSPDDFQQRLRSYPWMLTLYVLFFFMLTCLVEWLYTRRIIRIAEIQVPWKRTVKGVIYANLASYVILGPVYIFMQDWSPQGLIFTPDASWSSNATTTVVAINPHGQLESCQINGRKHRILLEGPVCDYVISEDLNQILYSNPKGQWFFQNGKTNSALPDMGFTCTSRQMDFSPSGCFIALLENKSNQLYIVNTTTKQIKIKASLSESYPNVLAWTEQGETVLTGGRGQYAGTSATNGPSYLTETARLDAAKHFYPVERLTMKMGRCVVRCLPRLFKPTLLYIQNKDKELFRFSDPTGWGNFSHASLLNESGETIFRLGKMIYVLDPHTRRMAPVMRGDECLVLKPAFLKSYEDQ